MLQSCKGLVNKGFETYSPEELDASTWSTAVAFIYYSIQYMDCNPTPWIQSRFTEYSMRLSTSLTRVGLLSFVGSVLASDVLDLTQGSFKGEVFNEDLALVE